MRVERNCLVPFMGGNKTAKIPKIKKYITLLSYFLSF